MYNEQEQIGKYIAWFKKPRKEEEEELKDNHNEHTTLKIATPNTHNTCPHTNNTKRKIYPTHHIATQQLHHCQKQKNPKRTK